MKKLIFVFTCLLLAIPCQARIITVDANGAAEFNNIQAAINDSNDGDTIIVADGTYTGEGNRDINFLGKAITIRSTDPNDPNIVAATIIDCNGTEANPHRGFTFNHGEDPNSILCGLTITNGYGPSDTSVLGYYWSCGGAILCNDCSPTISHCNITRNSGSDLGGGVFCYWVGSKPMIKNCTIAGNSAEAGGGICYQFAYPIISHCTIADNSSYGYGGGGILCLTSDPLGAPGLISNCKIKGNSAEGHGGGVFCDWKTNINISNCTISGNSAGDGGGICCYDFAINAMFKNCTITGNSADIGGGISYTGGGVYSTITNCILWNDKAGYGNEIALRSSSPSGCYITAHYSIIQGGSTGVSGGIVSLGPGIIDADPCFTKPGYWNDNGTPTDASDDFWVDGDYHLKSQAGRWDTNSESWVTDANTSVAIDAGDPNSDWTAELWPHGKRINMGAYGGTPQASMSPLIDLGYIADLNNDDKVDSRDLKLFTNEWQNEQLLLSEDLDRNGFVDFNDFAIFGLQWSYPIASEPGITYQIEKCDPNSYRSPAAEQATEIRFSVLVEGSYIHFKDMMVANCCTEELGLEMTVEEDLITIYEIEYIPGVCFCICDYPVTATLGPFEPGTYTLEVYEEWSGFIESTTIVINPPR